MKRKKIFIISIIGVAILLTLFVWQYSRQKDNTASFTIPSKGQYRVGEIFPVELTLLNQKHSINAIQADIRFDPKNLEVVTISTRESFATIFIQKEIDNTKGFARLTGGLPNPGWAGKKGEFATVYFKTKKPGLVTIQFLPSSLILANDGKGTNILDDLPSASYLILPERISQEEETQQKKFLSQGSVLGESTRRGQLVFCEGEGDLPPSR